MKLLKPSPFQNLIRFFELIFNFEEVALTNRIADESFYKPHLSIIIINTIS